MEHVFLSPSSIQSSYGTSESQLQKKITMNMEVIGSVNDIHSESNNYKIVLILHTI